MVALALALGAHPTPAGAQSAPAPAPSATRDTLPPKPIADLDAAYPEGASGDAEVALTLLIEPDGSVSAAVPDRSDEPFSGRAVAAALGWKFEPATRLGLAVRVRIRVKVTFHEPPPAPAPAPAEEAAAPAAGTEKPAARRAPKPIEIQVRGVKMDPSRTVTLSRAEVRQIPGTFGDPFRALEIMPGVTPIISGLPFFFVRGAPPGDVGYFLDGIRVPLLFHIGVGPSVIHPALIERVDLYPGGYPARFGRFSGGVVSGETTPPASELHGEYNVRLFDAGALVEAPFDDHRGDVLLAGRYSYTAALLSLLNSSTELDYWDYQARVGYQLTPEDKLSLFAFGSYDYLGERTSTTTLTLFGAEFHRLDARYDHELGDDGKLRLAVTAGLDRSRLPDDRFVRDRLLGTRSEWELRLGPSVLLRAGSDVELDAYDVQFNTSQLGPAAASAAGLFPTRTDLSAGTRADLVLSLGESLQLTPGVRVDYYSSQGQSAIGVDPRLSSRLEVSKRLRLLSSFGIAHQPPAFVVPLPGFQPGGLRGGLQTAVQQSGGIEYDFGDATTGTATVFHNGFFHMSDPLGATQMTLNGCPPGSFPDDTLGGDRGAVPTSARSSACGRAPFTPGTVGPDRSGGSGQGADSRGSTRAATALEARTNGQSYGLELFLKRQLTSRLGGFLSYTLSRSVRSFDNRSFTATFDRTHVANAAVAYNLGRHWRAGTRVTFYTGLPKVSDPTDPSSTRLPPFFKLDLRLEKRWQLGPRAYISFIAEWMNATLSKEAISTTCTLQGCQTQTIGPITIPSLGIEGGF
ncbi:MAG: TonB-dependent receptor plug domain-containing protein [Pseudomonadota bacterium]